MSTKVTLCTLFLLMLIASSSCGGGGGASIAGAPGGGGNFANTVSGSVDLPIYYPVVYDWEGADSTLTSSYQVAEPTIRYPLAVTGNLEMTVDDVDSIVMPISSGNYALRLSYMDYSQPAAYDVDAEVYYSDGVTSVQLAALVSLQNPETTVLTVPGAGWLYVDIGLLAGSASSWRVDVRVGTSFPAQSGRFGKSASGDSAEGEESAVAAAENGKDSDLPSLARRGLRSCEAVSDTVIVRFKGTASDFDRAALLERHGLALRRTLSSGSIVARREVPSPLAGLDHVLELHALTRLLALSPMVEFAEPDWIARALVTTPNDPYAFQAGAAASQQWHYDMIRLRSAWDITTGDPSIIVAVLDTGVVLTHPDLTSRLVQGYDFVSDSFMSNDGNGIDADPNDPGTGFGNNPDSWHGTHVAGTIAAATNNGLGVTGVAPGCRVMPVRVLGLGGSGTSSDIAEGIRYAAGLTNASGTLPVVAARIINMSLGGPGPESAEQAAAIAAATNAGTICIAAAGNDSNSTTSYPASNTNVISVGSVGRSATRAPYSNYNQFVEIAAPGGDQSANVEDGILSTFAYRDNFGVVQPAYWYSQGTSMACPHIAGVVALILSADPALTLAQVRATLAGTAVDLGVAGRDVEYGHGLVDAYAAVSAAASTTAPVAPTVAPITDEVVIYSDQLSASILVKNAGTGTLTVSLQSVLHYGSESWAVTTVTPTTGGHLVTVTPNRAGITFGNLYIAWIVLNTNDAAAQVRLVPVYLIQMNRDPFTVPVKVSLLNGTFNTVKETTATTDATGRIANFSIPNVGTGTYWLIAYCDINNNQTLDQGEFYGSFPDVDQPRTIVVGGGVITGLFFRLLEVPEPVG